VAPTALNIYIQLSSSTNKPRVFIQNGNCAGNTYIDTTSSISGWTHICVRENNTKADLWIDGVRQGETTKATSGFCSNLGSYNLGKNGDYGTQFFNGRLDETFFVFEYISDNNITAFYNSGNGLFYDDIPTQGGTPAQYFEVNAKVNRTGQTLNNFTAMLYSNNYTQTYSTGNGSVFFNIPQNDYTINVSSGGYAIFITDLENINNSDTYTAYLNDNNTININIYDGITFDLLNGTEVNIIIYGNETSYYTQTATTNGTLYLTNLSSDTYEFTFYNNEYPRQNYFVSLADNEYKELNAYILNTTYVSNVVVNIIDPYGLNIDSALVTIQQLISGSYTTIAQKYTDATGSSLFYLQIGTTYKAVIDKTNYVTQTATITPTQNPYEVTLRLNPQTILNYTNFYSSCLSSYSFNPNINYLGFNYGTGSYLQNFTLSLTSPDGVLSYWGVYYNNSKYTNRTASPNGGTSYIELNITDTGLYPLIYFFKCSGFDEEQIVINYYTDILNKTNATMTANAEFIKDRTTPVQRFGIILLTIIVVLLVCFEVSVPVQYYGLPVMVILIFFTIVEWLDIRLSSVLLVGLGFATFFASRGGDY
jgi:hypothetical protein